MRARTLVFGGLEELGGALQVLNTNDAEALAECVKALRSVVSLLPNRGEVGDPASVARGVAKSCLERIGAEPAPPKIRFVP